MKLCLGTVQFGLNYGIEKKKLKTSEILFTLSGIIFILLICTTVFLLIKINVLETKFESLNEKTTKMEKDLN